MSTSGRAPKRAPIVLTQGYALASLMSYYGDPAIAVVQPEQRMRWIFAPSPPETLFAAPGLAIAEAGRRFDLVLGMRFRKVEPAGMVERRRAGRAVQSYELFRVADPYRAGARSALPARRGRSSAEMPAVTGKPASISRGRQRAEAEARAPFARVGRAHRAAAAVRDRAACAGAFRARRARARR